MAGHGPTVENRRKILKGVAAAGFLFAVVAAVVPDLRGQTATNLVPAQAVQTNAVPTRARGVNTLLARYAKQLDLTAEQKAKVKLVLEESQKQRAAVRTDASLSQEERRAKATALERETNSKIRDLLTDAQKVKWDAAQKNPKRSAA